MASADFKAEADRKFQALASKQGEFGALGPGGKAQLLSELLAALKAAQPLLPALADACVVQQGYDPPEDPNADSTWALEQIIFAACITSCAGRLKSTLETLAKTGQCPAPKMLHHRETDGRTIARVYPLDSGDSMKPTKDWIVDVWIKPGEQPTQGNTFARKPTPGSVGIVLGAGNMAVLGVLDCLHMLFHLNSVVLYKMHYLRTYQEAFVRRLFEPLIAKGYFEVIKEEHGVCDAQYLVNHPLLSRLHMTGSTETHDAIVWGPKDGRQERKAKNKPVMDLGKLAITSELGCVTPFMVCPGQWSDTELAHYARHLAFSCTSNNGYFCNSPKVLVLADGWSQKDAFMQHLRSTLATLPAAAPYYPGSHRRYQAYEEAYGGLEKIQGPGFGTSKYHGEHLPWSLAHVTVDPADLAASANEYAFKNEPFCPVLCVCTITGVSTPEGYLEAATALSNKVIWGRLSCTLMVHPETEKNSAAAVERAIADLEYGTVAINVWSAHSYSFESGVWGAYGGGTPPLERIECVESGIGFVNNALAFDHVEKCVCRATWMDKTTITGCTPPVTREVTLTLTNFLINPSVKNLLKLLCPSLFSLKVQLLCVFAVGVVVALVAMKVL
jgi:hypothetical protein